jgi:DNA replication and repair protein RecF
MILKRFYLKNFRNYEECSIIPAEELNLVVGPNGWGKSNLLEGIFLISVGRDPWGAELKELVRFGESDALVRGEWEKRNMVELRINKSGSKEIILNEKRLHRLSTLVGLFPSSIAGPQEVELVVGSPKVRRRLLDLHLSQISREYLESLTRYQKYLKGRNQLLKGIREGTEPIGGELYIETWDEKLVEEGAKILTLRRKFLEALTPVASQIYRELSGEPLTLTLQYEATVKDGDTNEIAKTFLRLLKKNREREVELGETIVGPHRDDFQVFLGERALRVYGSWGECRSASLAIILGISHLLAEKYETSPVIILDDCFANLDNTRMKNLLQLIRGFGQVFASTPTYTTSLLEASGKIFRLAGPGRIEEEK